MLDVEFVSESEREDQCRCVFESRKLFSALPSLDVLNLLTSLRTPRKWPQTGQVLLTALLASALRAASRKISVR